MTYADTTERPAFIDGLRALADYLESNPEVPTPVYSIVHTFPPHDDEWAGMTADIDVVAAMLGVSSEMTYGGHYVAARFFGPVEYRAVAIPPHHEEGA